MLFLMVVTIVCALCAWTFLYMLAGAENRGSYLSYMGDHISTASRNIVAAPGNLIDLIGRKLVSVDSIVNTLEMELEEYYAMNESYPKHIREVVSLSKYPDSIAIIYKRITPQSYELKVIDQKSGYVAETSDTKQ